VHARTEGYRDGSRLCPLPGASREINSDAYVAIIACRARHERERENEQWRGAREITRKEGKEKRNAARSSPEAANERDIEARDDSSARAKGLTRPFRVKA